jgi:hypothetical protein
MANTMHNIQARKGAFGILGTGTGADNGIGTASTTTGKVIQIAYVTVKYSNTPTQAGVTVVLDSGIAAAYDTTLHTGSANVPSTVFAPDYDLILCEDDQIDVTAPAGGSGITSAIAIYGWLL